MIETSCRLCNKKSNLQESHIVPKLIFRWLKRTSSTGYLRLGSEINKRVQDGLKFEWLCFECEQRLSGMEKYFSDKIFHPLCHGKSVLYNDNFLKFSVSLSWRVLKYFQEIGALKKFNIKTIEESDKALSIWENFLFDRNKNPGKYEQHFYSFLEDIISCENNLPNNIHRYLHRAVDIDILSNKNIAFVYIKLPFLLFIGYINIDNPKAWRETRIRVDSGQINPVFSPLIPLELWREIKRRASDAQILKSSISQVQQEKINKDYRDHIEKSSQSETIKSLTKDVSLFGMDSVFSQKGKKENR